MAQRESVHLVRIWKGQSRQFILSAPAGLMMGIILSVPDQITSILSASGPIAIALGADFESRPEQVEMAAAVAQAMEKPRSLPKYPRKDGAPKRAPLG